MTTGDLLRRLLSAYAARDDVGFRTAADGLIREERAKNHRLLADDLDRILRKSPNGRMTFGIDPVGPTAPRDRDRDLPLLRMIKTDDTWNRLVLPEESLDRLRRLVDEHKRQELLEARGLRPTQRALFVGPPGTGKTLAAAVIANALDYPLALVRFDALVSSLLGQTAANLAQVFEFIQKSKAVVLFDEFDAIAKERADPTEHGELRRVVNAFLQLLDAYEGDSLLIAATNHEAMLDTAIWRRFEMVVRFDLPARQDRVVMLRAFFRSFQVEERALEGIADKTGGASGSDLQVIATNAARNAVLRFEDRISRADLDAALREFMNRSQPIE